MYTLQFGHGNFVTDEDDMLWTPRPLGSNKVGAVLCHGAGVPIEYATATGWAGSTMAGAIALSGVPCVAGAFGGDLFGNDTAMANIDAAIAYMNLKLGTRTDRVHLVGVSMGGYTALRWAINNPGKVASVTGILPLVDIVDAYTTNSSGLRAQIEAGWGVTYPAALPARADLNALRGVLVGKHVQLYYDDVDAIIPQATVQAFAAAVGAEIHQLSTNYGHAETSTGTVGTLSGGNWKAVTGFIAAHG